MNWWYGYGWFFPGFFWIIIWIFIVIFIFRGGRHRWEDRYDREKNAEEVLADRFARGEIDEKEYEKRLEVIRKHVKTK